MTISTATLRGACLCGAVTYQVTGPFNMMVHCHCSMCRKHHGSAFATFVGAPLMGFKWLSGQDQLVTYASSEKGRRAFCRQCGSVAPSLIPDMDLAMLPAGNLEGDPEVRPQSHIFVGSKAPWYTITDDLPQHEEYPPEFGISGVSRPVSDIPEGVVAGSCLCNSIAYEIDRAGVSHCPLPLFALSSWPQCCSRLEPVLQTRGFPFYQAGRRHHRLPRARSKVLRRRVLQQVRRRCAADIDRTRRGGRAGRSAG